MITDPVAEKTKNKGLMLAEGKWKDLCEDLEDPYMKACVAILLENEEQHIQSLKEETTNLYPGIATFEKYAAPLVRAITPNLVASEIVSMQPMQGPTGIVFYLQFLFGSNKGATKAGTPVHDFVDSNYSSEIVEAESIGVSGAAHYQGTLSYVRVRPGTVEITDGTLVVTDDGAGNLIGDVGVGTNTIDYNNGDYDVTFSAPTIAAVTADYEFDLENTDTVPEIDLVLTSSPIVGRIRKLRSRWSMEAQINLKSVHGLDAEQELTAILAEELKFEVDREIISQVHSIASAGLVQFHYNVPPNVSINDHYQGFTKTLIKGSNLIFKATRRATGNWIVAGVDVLNIIEDHPAFVPSGISGVMGVYKAGTMSGKWSVYKDPYFPDTKFLIGYKGISFLETGYIYAPYVPLYMSPTVTLDDFKTRKGMATWYGKKVVNSKFYCLGEIIP